MHSGSIRAVRAPGYYIGKRKEAKEVIEKLTLKKKMPPRPLLGLGPCRVLIIIGGELTV